MRRAATLIHCISVLDKFTCKMPFTGWVILLPLVLMQLTFSGVHGNLPGNSVHCLPDQAVSLLQLKQSFSFDSTTTLPSWQAGTDCCLWEGISCNVSSGEVSALSLPGRGLYSYGIDSALFNLTSLQHLDLSGNSFGGLDLPIIGFERLSLLINLNLSGSGLSGQIPISIGYLTSLVSLDLSSPVRSIGMYSRNMLVLWEPSFTALVAKLTNLRELYLDWVDVSASGEEWCGALARYVPHLEILSLDSCRLYGPIHVSLSKVRSLTVINLHRNDRISGAVPDFFADFQNLSVLQLGDCGFDGLIPPRIFELKKLRVLDLSYNSNMLVHLPGFLNGSSLEILNVQDTNFSTASPSSFSNLKSLEELHIDGKYKYLTVLPPSSFKSLKKLHLSQLQSETPVSWWIWELQNLTYLEIFSSNFSGRTPSWIGNLRNLRTLEIFDCIFSGPIPSTIGNLKNLTNLGLWNCGLSGRIPAWVGNLTQLSYLDLDTNYFRGEIPDSIFTLPALQTLDLSSNRLSGRLRDFPASSSSLHLIAISDNQLDGPMRSLIQIKSLQELYLGSNNFMIDQTDLISLLQLRELQVLDLSNNRLSVIDGQRISLPSVPRLLALGLASCNLTKIPDFLQLLHHVIFLDISDNHISGSIPKWIWDNWSNTLLYLNLSNNNFSSMELSSPFLPTALQTLDLSSNRLQGEIPIPLKSTNLQFLDYSNNRFSSILQNCTSCLGKSTYLKMANNRIRGEIPHFICNTSKLEILDLSNNSFSGTIPSCLIQSGHLSVLNLRDNHLEGSLVASKVDKRCALQTINVDGNRIEGQLPRSLTDCKDLEFLDVGNNKIVDSFPHWLGKLPKLRILVLRSNQLHGSIGNTPEGEDHGEPFSSLQIIDVASNNLSGNLSSPWFEKLVAMIRSSDFTGDIIEAQNLTRSYEDIVTVTFKGQYMTFEKIWTTLTIIDFSDNAFTGSIPESIGRLARLHGLNLSKNMLTGEIPAQLCGMTALESLDLSSNELSGVIPEELTDLTSLGTLNLSNNQFIGKIPELRQFGTFQNNSYEGNAGLCGAPLSKQCDSHVGGKIASKYSNQVDVILFIVIGIGYGLGFAAGLLIKWSCIASGTGQQTLLDRTQAKVCLQSATMPILNF